MSRKRVRQPKPSIKFTLGDIEFRVKFKIGYAEKTGCDGRCYYGKRLIIVDDDLEGFNLYETLIHEARHGHQSRTGLFEILDEQAREMDCQTTVSFVFQMIRLLNQLAASKS